ncbi:MAG: phosphoenolpyruvate carboxykinase (ATP) [Caldibacillus sp.]
MNSIRMVDELDELINGNNAAIQLSVPKLVEKVIERNEGQLTSTGAVVVTTGKYTGRSPKDKFFVAEESVKNKIDWGDINQPISSTTFVNLYKKVLDYLKEKDEIFVFKGFAGADPKYRLPIQVINEYAWHNLFAHQLFIRPNESELLHHQAEFTLIFAPGFKADPVIDGVRSETFIIISLEQKIVLIGGTEYAGEMKKAIFTVMNYLLPERGILSMHCSANAGPDGDVALFFGLSGTGKTTLSTDSERKLIGDDEHGWTDEGIFNIEGGCYAKCINLSKENEPQIYQAIQFGAILENVIVDPQTRVPDYTDASLTVNTRAAYPLHAIENIAVPSIGGHPKTIIFLTADAFGVLPPISLLTKEQAMYHFLSGYTSKIAGTERGITEPEATFSTCYGAPFLPLPAQRYAELLGEKIDRYNVKVYLVNTGWTGGGYGVGERIKLSYTRAMVRAAIAGKLSFDQTVRDDFFGLYVPKTVPGVPDDLLMPINTWSDKTAYKQTARELAERFRNNFQKFQGVDPNIEKLGGPII